MCEKKKKIKEEGFSFIHKGLVWLYFYSSHARATPDFTFLNQFILLSSQLSNVSGIKTCNHTTLFWISLNTSDGKNSQTGPRLINPVICVYRNRNFAVNYSSISGSMLFQSLSKSDCIRFELVSFLSVIILQ